MGLLALLSVAAKGDIQGHWICRARLKREKCGIMAMRDLALSQCAWLLDVAVWAGDRQDMAEELENWMRLVRGERLAIEIRLGEHI